MGLEGNNEIKAMYNKLTVSITLSGEKLGAFPLYSVM